MTTDLPFEEWVVHVFDWDDSFELDASNYKEMPSAKAVRYITRLFENLPSSLARYSDDQIGVGLNDLLADDMFALQDPSVPGDERCRCVRSFYQLFSKIFASRCETTTVRTQKGDSAPYNQLKHVCFMWWDVIPVSGHMPASNQREFDQTVLSVMEEILALPSLACQRSALHGLGHWCLLWYPEQAQQIIDDYLRRNPNIPTALKEYAKDAWAGYVQ